MSDYNFRLEPKDKSRQIETPQEPICDVTELWKENKEVPGCQLHQPPGWDSVAGPALPLQKYDGTVPTKAQPKTDYRSVEVLTVDSPQLLMHDGLTNPISPPGLPGGDTSFYLRSSQTSRLPDGDEITEYTGLVKDQSTWLYKDTFEAESTTGDNHQLMNQHIHYSGNGQTLTFDAGENRSRRIVNVFDVDTHLNAGKDGYDTIITTHEGRKFHAIEDISGKVQFLTESAADLY